MGSRSGTRAPIGSRQGARSRWRRRCSGNSPRRWQRNCKRMTRQATKAMARHSSTAATTSSRRSSSTSRRARWRRLPSRRCMDSRTTAAISWTIWGCDSTGALSARRRSGKASYLSTIRASSTRRRTRTTTGACCGAGIPTSWRRWRRSMSIRGESCACACACCSMIGPSTTSSATCRSQARAPSSTRGSGWRSSRRPRRRWTPA